MPTYLVTFTSYGTWLHGDARLSHDRKTWSIVEPDPALEAQMRMRMKHEAVTLNGPMRKVVRESIQEHCDHRQWELRAINVRTNHIHAVIRAQAEGARVLNSVKSRATRMLREAGLIESDHPVWTERGSSRLLETEEDIVRACEYVRNGQGPDLPDT